MAAVLTMEGASYRFPSATGFAVGPVDLSVQAGEIVLLCGPTGSGKSTLLRLAGGLLQRHGHGEVGGQVRVLGQDPAALPPSQRAGIIGFAGQVPPDQLVTGSVADELAFAPESAGWPSPRIEARTLALIDALGLPDPRRAPRALSGGQQQRLVVGAALAAGARLLLLDEPLAMLDPQAAQELLGALRELADTGVAIVLVEHRVALARPWADRVVALEGGRLTDGGCPPPTRTPVPVASAPGALLLRAQELRHDFGEVRALDGVALEVREHERIALIGANGAGKSTLLGALSGAVPAGPVTGGARVVDVPQDPDLALFCATVAEEVGHGPSEDRLPVQARRQRTAQAMAALSVEALADRPPQALSRGQRLRVAVAAALACQPDVLLLDEPTAAQDPEQVERMMQALVRQGPRALVFATHDMGLAARFATRVVRLEAGRIVAEGPPAKVLGTAPSRTPDTPPTPLPAPVPERVDPRTRIALLFFAGLLAVSLERPLALGLLTLASAAALVATRVPRRTWLRGATAVLAITWGTALSQGIFYALEPRVPLVSLGPLVVYREGVAYGLLQSLRMVSVTLAGLAVARSTAPDRLFAALLRLRLPFGAAFLLVTALRFVPEVAREVMTVRQARARRGRPAHQRPPWAWLTLEVSLLRPVVARALRRARNLATSLDARGFDPLAPRAVRRPLHMGALDGLLLLLGVTITLPVVAGRLLFVAYTAEIAWFPALRGVYGFVRGWL